MSKDSGKTDAGNVAITCGSNKCAIRRGLGIEKITQCCTDSNECGLKFPGVDKCLPPDQVGSKSTACGNYQVPEVPTNTLTGCCTAKGCGKNDAFLGCILNEDLGLGHKDCTYDPTNNCTAVSEIPCDGSEDCPAGKHCCTALGSGGPDQTGCYDSCARLEAEAGAAAWRELCHAGDKCENPQYDCRTSQSLPAWLNRCFTGLGQPAATNLDKSAGSVNCGDGVCGKGQKCCAVTPATGPAILYCAGANEECKCHAPDAGGKPMPRPASPADAGTG